MPTPDEIETRRVYLASLSTRDADSPLQPDAPHASVNNRRWFRHIDGKLTPTLPRARLHEQILEQWRDSNPHVAAERNAIIMAGPPGAGKSSTHDQLFDGLDRRQWRELDADVFKRYLLEEAVADGTLQGLLPPDLRAQPGEASRFYPFELSALVHRESTDFLFDAAMRESVARGDNLIIDGTLSWKSHAERLVGDLSRAGYTIRVVDVEASQDVAADRIVERWREGLVQALEQPADPSAQLGGRWVPATAVDGLFTEFREPDKLPLHGKSVTEVNALEVSETHAAVTQYDLYWTAAADLAAERVERRERLTEGGQLTVTWTADTTRPQPLGVDRREADSAIVEPSELVAVFDDAIVEPTEPIADRPVGRSTRASPVVSVPARISGRYAYAGPNRSPTTAHRSTKTVRWSETSASETANAPSDPHQRQPQTPSIDQKRWRELYLLAPPFCLHRCSRSWGYR